MRFVTFAVTALAAMPFGLADPAREGGRKQGGRLNKAKLNELQSNKKTTTNAEINIPELTSELVCDDLGIVTASADAIYDLVKSLDGDCDQTESWVPVREAIYTLEFQLDAFDIIIDQFDLTKCFECRDESKIACCFRSYAESLIAALKIIAEKIEYLDGETAYYIVTAINSLRDADHAFVNELLRRLQCEQYIHEVVQKEGALDGSTSGSIRAAFALFVSTPYITGEEFKTDDGRQGRKPKVCDIEIIDQIKHKNKGKGHGYKGHGSKKGCSSGCGGSTRHIPTKQTVEIAN